jgi:hypothetical protein
MTKAIRTTLGLVVSLVLLNALTMAQPGGSNADKDKNKEHHSRLTKFAFWRHHKASTRMRNSPRPRRRHPNRLRLRQRR